MKSTAAHSVQEITDQAKAVLSEERGLRLAILYGSAATGKLRTDSDLDIALLFDVPMNAERKMEIISRLGSRLQREVDLVDLRALNGTILKQILRKGRVLMQAEPGVLAGLVRKMIYNQADMMPYVSRTLLERQRRFIHG